MRSKTALRFMLSTAGSLALALAITAAPAHASTGHLRAHPSPGFNKATVKTIEGQIAGVEDHDSGNGWQAVHVFVKSGSETWDVPVAPAYYLSRKGVSFKKGAEVTVTGSAFRVDGAPVLVAEKLEMGPTNLAVRSADGKPMWPKQRGFHW